MRRRRGPLPLCINKRARRNGTFPRATRPGEPKPGSMKAAQDIRLGW